MVCCRVRSQSRAWARMQRGHTTGVLWKSGRGLRRHQPCQVNASTLVLPCNSSSDITFWKIPCSALFNKIMISKLIVPEKDVCLEPNQSSAIPWQQWTYAPSPWPLRGGWLTFRFYAVGTNDSKCHESDVELPRAQVSSSKGTLFQQVAAAAGTGDHQRPTLVS